MIDPEDRAQADQDDRDEEFEKRMQAEDRARERADDVREGS